MKISITDNGHVKILHVTALPLAKGIWYVNINTDHKHIGYSIVSSLQSVEIWLTREGSGKAYEAIVRFMPEDGDGIDGCYTAELDCVYGPSLILLDDDMLQRAVLSCPR
jgi:hypothetical protein